MSKNAEMDFNCRPEKYRIEEHESLHFFKDVEKYIEYEYYDAASGLLERYLEEFPESNQANRLLAKVRRLQGRPLDSAVILEKLLNRPRATLQNDAKNLQVTSDEHDYILHQSERIVQSRERYVPGEEFQDISNMKNEQDIGYDPPKPPEHFCDTELSPDQPDSHGLENPDIVRQEEHSTAAGYTQSDLVLDDIDPALLDDYLFDFDEAPTHDDIKSEVAVEGAISRRERAYQHALELGQRYDWDHGGIELLTEVFERYWWSAAKRSMERELEAGLVPEELRLALHARDLWHAYPEFSIAIQKFPHADLSWPVSIRLVRAFRSYPDPEEIDIFLYNAFEDWRNSSSKRRVYPSFHDYLYARLSFPSEFCMTSPAAQLSDGYYFCDDDYYSTLYAGHNTPLYEDLNYFNLLPVHLQNHIPRSVCSLHEALYDD